MEKYIVSARKYRPITFSSVVGQNHITTTLKNAIKSNHLAQAFLFCGPRGVGKTTCARILAKTINCFNVDENIEPCNKCESCVSFIEGRSLNISELDAASNNSVDDIRALVDQVRFVPQIGKYKVFIIDEVHMLSNSAFNAFLKTLEEPPPHAIFILATTEKHKIIPTILSRCQIFDFNRIRVEDMANHLAEIAQKENITYENDGLHIIAQKADGALRDALSMFDQIVTFAGNHVSYKAVIENLNILDYDYYFKLTDDILQGNISASLILYNDILGHGFEGNFFINGLAFHLRNLLVSRDTATLQLLETSPNIKERYKNQAQLCSLTFLIKGLDICTKTEAAYKNSVNQRLLVELAIMQLCALQVPTPDGEKKKVELEPNPQYKTVANNTSTAAEPINNTIQNTNIAASGNMPNTAHSKPLETPNTHVETNQQPLPVTKDGIVNKVASSKPTLASIKRKINKEDTEEKVTVLQERNHPFTEEQLQQSWDSFALNMKNKGKSSLSHTLSCNKPQLIDNNIITYTIFNSVQENDLNTVLGELKMTLQNDLQNDTIQIKLIINKEDTEKKPYTNREKYIRMAQINPQIENLRKKLDLDV